MPQQELLKKVAAFLDAEGIPYMLTGSIVSSLQGEPRSTHDIDNPYDKSRFARRKMVQVLGSPMSVSTSEDTILSKLRWAKLSGGSEKQFGDALGVCEVQWGALDLGYIGEWAEKIGVMDLWSRILRELQVS